MLYDKDEYICIYNEEIENIFYVIKGAAKLVILQSDNKEFILLN